MRLLLDTHTFLWFILNDPKLSRRAKDLISDGDNVVEISPASYWEIAIKISLGKYALPEPYWQTSWSVNWRPTTSAFYESTPSTRPF